MTCPDPVHCLEHGPKVRLNAAATFATAGNAAVAWRSSRTRAATFRPEKWDSVFGCADCARALNGDDDDGGFLK